MRQHWVLQDLLRMGLHACLQAVMGKLLKGHLARQWGLDPASIYHCAVMPCYDKKLEASREDFYLPGKLALRC